MDCEWFAEICERRAADRLGGNGTEVPLWLSNKHWSQLAALLREPAEKTPCLPEQSRSLVMRAANQLRELNCKSLAALLVELVASLTPPAPVKWDDHTHYSTAEFDGREAVVRESQTLDDTEWVWHVFTDRPGPWWGFGKDRDTTKAAAEARLRELVGGVSACLY